MLPAPSIITACGAPMLASSAGAGVAGGTPPANVEIWHGWAPAIAVDPQTSKKPPQRLRNPDRLGPMEHILN